MGRAVFDWLLVNIAFAGGWITCALLTERGR